MVTNIFESSQKNTYIYQDRPRVFDKIGFGFCTIYENSTKKNVEI